MKKAPTFYGQGMKSGVDNLFSDIKAAFVNVLLTVAAVGRAGGVR